MNAILSRLVYVLVAAAVLCSCTKTTGIGVATKTHHLRIADGTGDLPTLNPHLYTLTVLGFLSELTMAYLARYDQNNRPVPELATVIPTRENGGISADGRTITWHIRKGVRWSDGAPFDADDVVFTTHVVLNPANDEVGRDGWDLITKIDEPDKYTVVYHLSKPYASFLPTFFGTAGANPCILPKHLLEKYPNINAIPYNALPVGIGPFRYTAWKRGDSIELEANPYYWRGLPKLKRITYELIPSRDTLVTLMETGDVDLWPQVPPQYITDVKPIQRLTTILQPAAYYGHVDFNVTRPLVSDVRIRDAVRYALDRPTIMEKSLHGNGIVQESIISPAVSIAPQNISMVPYDPAKARSLLDAAGWKVGPDGIRTKNGQRLSLQLPFYTGSAATDNQVELMRAMLKAVGIEIQTRKFATSKFFDTYQNGGILYGGKWDMTLFLWQNDPGGDISNNWECNQIPPNGQNDTRFCNAQLDAWLERFKRTYSEGEHASLLDREVRLILSQVPTIVLDVPKFGFAYSRNLTGFHPGAQTPFDNMMDVDI
jgi:peptide/nickel transport system substrate-binding protein